MILSICVPNRNQSSALSFTLRYFLEQRIDLLQGIEILVSDNSSTDDSPDVIHDFINQFKFQAYFQEADIGFLGQLLFLASKAKGRYVLFLGAGDLIEISSLASIAKKLSQSHFSILTFEASEPIEPTYPLPSKASILFLDSEQHSEIPFFSPSISCNIFHTSKLLEVIAKIERLRNEWPHGQIALMLAKSKSLRGYSSQRLLQVHPTHSGWSHTRFAYDVLIEYDKLMREFVAAIPESKNLYGRNIGLSVNKFKRIVTLKLQGVGPSRRQFFDLARLYKSRTLLFVEFLLLMISPTIILNKIQKAIVLFKRIKSYL